MEDDSGDGFIIDSGLGLAFSTEHVCALDVPLGKKFATGEQRVIDAINLKIARGSDYAREKLLVAFFDGSGQFFRNKIRESIYGKYGFEAVFCVGLLNSGSDGYSYSVTEFRDSFGNQSVMHNVEINGNFTNWHVTKIMQ